MAYSLPELVLVGAAQNLVLNGSQVLNRKGGECDGDVSPADIDFDTYNSEATW